MSDCEHLNHPEHWLGDCGDMLDYIALLAPTVRAAAESALTTLAEVLGIPVGPVSDLEFGPFVASIR